MACISLGYPHLLTIERFNHEAMVEIEVLSGSLYTMEGQFQEFLLHSVRPNPKVKDKYDEYFRFSITFRQLIQVDKIPSVPITIRKGIKKREKPANDSTPSKQRKKLTSKPASEPGPMNGPGDSS